MAHARSPPHECVDMELLERMPIWIAGICKDLGMRPDRVPKLLCDNTAVLFLSQGNKSSKNSRHMLRRIQYLREMVEQMKIRIEHIPSAC